MQLTGPTMARGSEIARPDAQGLGAADQVVSLAEVLPQHLEHVAVLHEREDVVGVGFKHAAEAVLCLGGVRTVLPLDIPVNECGAVPTTLTRKSAQTKEREQIHS